MRSYRGKHPNRIAQIASITTHDGVDGVGGKRLVIETNVGEHWVVVGCTDVNAMPHVNQEIPPGLVLMRHWEES